MAHSTDSAARRPLPLQPATLLDALRWAITDDLFDSVALHGNVAWQAVDLVFLTLVWVFSDDKTLTGAFAEAHRWSMQVLGRAAIGTFQGLLKALTGYTAALLPLLRQRFHALMAKHAGAHWRIGRWLALAVDGTRVSVPRTKENEQAFCAPNYGAGKTARYRKKKGKNQRRRKKKSKPQPVKPQMWLTLLWHMGLHMPWCWKSGPSYASERDHLKQILAEQSFPADTLFCADAGFTGYELWKAIIDKGHSFLIRVGGNVKLLRGLGYVQERGDLVYCWPDSAARKKQPPLVLRLLRLRVGNCPMCLLTNVLDETQLSVQQAIELYKRRWGVELQFRSVKQTFGRRKLHSRTPERAAVELDWSLLGLWLIQLFAVKEQIEVGQPPQQCSVSLAIAVVRTMMAYLAGVPEVAMAEQLQSATKDNYQRQGSKKARYRPEYKDKPAAGKPIIEKATAKHKLWLQQYLEAAA
jgi:hypothetical protein